MRKINTEETAIIDPNNCASSPYSRKIPFESGRSSIFTGVKIFDSKIHVANKQHHYRTKFSTSTKSTIVSTCAIVFASSNIFSVEYQFHSFFSDSLEIEKRRCTR